MSKDPNFNVNVHLNDEVLIEAQRVPSELQDFVSLKFGWPFSIFIFNSSQAKTLGQAAMNAFRILKTIELEDEEAEMNRAWAEADDDEYMNCSIEHPCRDCIALD